MTDVDTRILVATIAGAFGLLVAFANSVISIFIAFHQQKHQKELSDAQGKFMTEIESLRHNLQQRQGEENAKREYMYVARQRLYDHCEPLLFQLTEASENALKHIKTLAAQARSNIIQPTDTKKGWLRSSGYLMTSTIYTLLTPLAVLRLIQGQLTLVDLALDRRIEAQYECAKLLFRLLTDDLAIAKSGQPLTYNPIAPEAHDRAREMSKHYSEDTVASHAEHWPQGVLPALLDQAVEAMINREGQAPRVKTYGEFWSEYPYQDEAPEDLSGYDPKYPFWYSRRDDKSSYAKITDIVLGFHPQSRPVTWRILITQSHVYEAIIGLGRIPRVLSEEEAKSQIEVLLQQLPSIISADTAAAAAYNWRKEAQEERPCGRYDDMPFEAAGKYLKDWVDKLRLLKPDSHQLPSNHPGQRPIDKLAKLN